MNEVTKIHVPELNASYHLSRPGDWIYTGLRQRGIPNFRLVKLDKRCKARKGSKR